jgi:hypothetical protein
METLGLSIRRVRLKKASVTLKSWKGLTEDIKTTSFRFLLLCMNMKQMENNRGWNYLVQKNKDFLPFNFKEERKVNVYKGSDHE